jgi:hypothetical protein
VFGNEIYGIGCKQTSHFHHTTYFTRRTQNGSAPIQAGQFAWNYLHDNEAKYGIHYYDQTNSSDRSCDSLTGLLLIHHNFIENQRSAAISVKTNSSDESKVCWTVDVDIFNNIMINTGLGPVAELANGTQPYSIIAGGSIKGSFRIFNNLFLNVSDASSRTFGLPAVINYSTPDQTSSLLVTNNIIESGFKMPIVEGDEHTVTNNWVTISQDSSPVASLLAWGKAAIDDSNFYAERPFILGEHLSLKPGITNRPTRFIHENNPIDFYGFEYHSTSVTIGPFQM